MKTLFVIPRYILSCTLILKQDVGMFTLILLNTYNAPVNIKTSKKTSVRPKEIMFSLINKILSLL